MTGRRVDPVEAQRLGLVDDVVPAGEALGRALSRARVLAGMPRDALVAVKTAVDRGGDAPLHAGLALERSLFGYQFGSAERARRIEAFLERKRER